MAWIEFHDDVWDHYKLMRLCKITGLEDTNAVGKLASLWHFTLRNAWRDANLEPWGDEAIEAACKWRGEPGRFVNALRECGFLDGFTVHGWIERAGRLVNDRIYNEKRRKTSVKRRKPLATQPNPTQPNPTIPNRTFVSAQTVSVGRFQKPTPEEVTAYASSIGYALNGQKFWDYYESKGWRIGNVAMKNWQAAVRTWKTKDREDGNFNATPRGTGIFDNPNKTFGKALHRGHDTELRKVGSTSGQILNRIGVVPVPSTDRGEKRNEPSGHHQPVRSGNDTDGGASKPLVQDGSKPVQQL